MASSLRYRDCHRHETRLHALPRTPPVCTRLEVYSGREAVAEFDPEPAFECVDGCTWCSRHGVLRYGQDFRQLADHADLADATTPLRGERFVRQEVSPTTPSTPDLRVRTATEPTGSSTRGDRR